MRVLVTGGAGFIGSHVVDALAAAGHEPVIFDVRRSPHHAKGAVETVIGDLLDPAAVRRAAAGCHAIAHLAAAADVDHVRDDPASAEALNSRGTLNVLEAARAEGVERVLYASTIWVYGESEGDVDEDTALGLPDHLYTATKLSGEMYCRSYGTLYGLETTILRFGIPYGPRARPEAVIPIFVRKALAGEPLTIAGSGEQTRRFVYVEDLAEGVVSGLAPAAAGRVYNLVGDEDVSVRRIADTVAELVGSVEIVHTPGRTGDFRGAEVSGDRAAHELGWRASTRFAEGVRRYLEWHTAATAPAPTLAGVGAREPARWRERFAAGGLFTGAVGLLGAYLLVLHSLASGAVVRTVVFTAIVTILLLGFQERFGGMRGQLATTAVWTVAIAGGTAMFVPETGDVLGFGGPDAALGLLTLSGAGFGLALLAGTRRFALRRALEESPDSD